MRLNFKKIASVLATTVMLGSTVALAAAAWPSPFVSSGTGDAAVVYGANAPTTGGDYAGAVEIGALLDKSITVSGSTTASGEGDLIKIERTSDKINMDNLLTSVWGTSITKSDLKTLLKDGIFFNKQNSEYKYEQKFDIGGINFTHFSDSEYNSREPALGFVVTSSTNVANYTLQFVTYPESATSSTDGSLSDFENKNIEILGKNYYVLDFKNTSTSAGKLTLLDAATSSSLVEGEKKTIAVGDKSYEVSISFITSDEIILNVDGTDTEKLSATGTTYGNTYKLSDGTYIGIKTINVQNYAGGSKSVDFSLGTGKLEINGAAAGGSIKINDKSIDDLLGYMTFGSTSTKTTWQKLIIQWKISEKKFLTSGSELLMPGFEAIKFTMADPTISAKEITKIDYGSTDYVVLKTTIKGGDVTIPLLYMETNNGNITGLGQSATQKLATANALELIYNATSSSTSQYEGFVASWNNTRDSESYYLKATIRYDSDAVRNLTTIKDKITGDTLCEDRKAGDTCTIGNIILTVNTVAYAADGNGKSVNMTINSGGTFQRLYTKEGMTVYLPYNADVGQNEGVKGSINVTGATKGGSNTTNLAIVLSEEDKDGNLGKQDFSVNVTSSGSAGAKKMTINNVGQTRSTTGTGYETKSSSKIYESVVSSDLATKLLLDKTNTDQYFASIEYHGSEVYANVYIAAPSVTTGGAGKISVVKDTEVASVSGKNLIVVGGSCINSVAAKILGSDTPLCGEDWTAKTSAGAGKWLIKVAANPYAAADSGKVAMLVAGYDAADTEKAVAKVKEASIDASTTSSTVYPKSS